MTKYPKDSRTVSWAWRKGFYGLVTVVLVVLVIFGVVTTEQSESILASIGPLIGAIGTGAAFTYTNRGSDDRTTVEDLAEVAAAQAASVVPDHMEGAINELLSRVELLSASLVDQVSAGRHAAGQEDATYPGGGE